MTLEETIDAKNAAIRAAFDALSPDEQAVLLRIAERLNAALKGDNPNRVVGPVTCLEIIGKLGMLLAERNGHELA